jgi:hypothetical protein
MVHLLGEAGDGAIKNPVQTAGFWQVGSGEKFYRARRSEAPGWEAFFDDVAVHDFVIMDR